MKNLLSFFLLLLFLGCGDIEPAALISDQPASRPTPDVTESDVFDLNLVPEITLEFTVAEWNKLLQAYDLNPMTEKRVVAKFTYVIPGRTIVLDSTGVKLKGNTSRRRPEGNVGQLHDAFNADWHHSHFGVDFSKYRDAQRFKGLNKINLKWFKDDAAYVREIYCYDLFRRFGCWTAPRASYCRVKIKVQGDALPANFGVYALIESIDEDYIAKHGDKWNPAVGYLWKGGYANSINADFVQTSSMGVEDVNNTNPALSQYYAYDLKTRKDEVVSAKAQLTQFITDLNTKTGSNFQTWIAQQMDVPLFLRTYATSVVVGMWDDYWVNGNNFYFYFAGNGKAYFIPYDYDNTLGTSLLMSNSGTQNPLNWGASTGRPLLTKLLAIPQYQTMYKAYVKELTLLSNDYFAAPKSIPRIQAWQARIAAFVSNDTGEDMSIIDRPASWGNRPNYRLLSGNSQGGTNGTANFFTSRTVSIPW